MGFFDRFRKPTVTRYEYADRPISNRVVDDTTPANERVVDRPVTDERIVSDHRDSSGWLWLLLIPLFLLLGLGAYSYLANTNGVNGTQPNFLSRLFNHADDTSTTGNSSNGLQFGVGGAPATPTPTSSSSSGSTTSTSSVTATPIPTSSQAQSGSVQGTSTRQLPGEAPSTGRGGE